MTDENKIDFNKLYCEHNDLRSELWYLYKFITYLVDLYEPNTHYLIEKFVININESLREQIKIHKHALPLLLASLIEE